MSTTATYDPQGSSVEDITGDLAYSPVDGQVYRVVSQDWLTVEVELSATDATGMDDESFALLPVITLA